MFYSALYLRVWRHNLSGVKHLQAKLFKTKDLKIDLKTPCCKLKLIEF